MENQNKINRIIIGVLIVLTLVLGYRILTEQKRVEYYICYEQISSMTSSMDVERTEEYCKAKVYERND